MSIIRLIHTKAELMSTEETIQVYFCQMWGRGFLVRVPNRKSFQVAPIHEEVCGTDECARADWYLGCLALGADGALTVVADPTAAPAQLRAQHELKWAEFPANCFDTHCNRRECPAAVVEYFKIAASKLDQSG